MGNIMKNISPAHHSRTAAFAEAREHLAASEAAFRDVGELEIAEVVQQVK